MTARALPVHATGVATSLDESSVLAAADAGRAAGVALAALKATAVAAGASPMRDFINDLAAVLPIRLTVHQRELLESTLTRAVDALIEQRAG